MAGDLTLSAAEDELSGQWPDCLDRKPRAFRVLSGMWRILMAAGEDVGADLPMPGGKMRPAGYVVLQHAVRLDRPVQAYGRWMARIPKEYRRSVLNKTASDMATIDTDPSCIATLKHYRSLMPLAQEAHKPIFFLKPADGAIGGHMAAVQDCYRDFCDLAKRIAERCGIAMP